MRGAKKSRTLSSFVIALRVYGASLCTWQPRAASSAAPYRFAGRGFLGVNKYGEYYEDFGENAYYQPFERRNREAERARRAADAAAASERLAAQDAAQDAAMERWIVPEYIRAGSPLGEIGHRALARMVTDLCTGGGDSAEGLVAAGFGEMRHNDLNSRSYFRRTDKGIDFVRALLRTERSDDGNTVTVTARSVPALNPKTYTIIPDGTQSRGFSNECYAASVDSRAARELWDSFIRGLAREVPGD